MLYSGTGANDTNTYTLLTSADLNKDGFPDLFLLTSTPVANQNPQLSYSLALGNGDGTFKAPTAIVTNDVNSPSAGGMYAMPSPLKSATTAKPPASWTKVSEGILDFIFELTVTEARLARYLAEGLSLRAASMRLGISEGHARQRLKTVFVKTGTRRQGELLALLAKLGDRAP